MRARMLVGVVLASLLIAGVGMSSSEAYVAKRQAVAQTLVERAAPGFEAVQYKLGEFKRVSLGDFRGQWAILFFYPQAFSYVCPTEINKLVERYGEIKALGAEVLALSVDSPFTIKAWLDSDAGLKDVSFPVLSDSPHKIGETYGVMNTGGSNHLRATFIIDPEGVVQYADVYNEQVGRSVSELIRTLQALQTGGFCPVEWRAGEPTLEVPVGVPYR